MDSVFEKGGQIPEELLSRSHLVEVSFFLKNYFLFLFHFLCLIAASPVHALFFFVRECPPDYRPTFEFFVSSLFFPRLYSPNRHSIERIVCTLNSVWARQWLILHIYLYFCVPTYMYISSTYIQSFFKIENRFYNRSCKCTTVPS